ncbi:MAG: DNA repair protein RadA [Firmicutes bacterium]|nr:DNA repair protein RadA [Bacillota bacterium]
MKKSITYVCSECGCVHDRWQGKCRECGSWDSLVETVNEPAPAKKTAQTKTSGVRQSVELSKMKFDANEEKRSSTGISELDRALGGGIVRSSVTLLSGEPGIGKSTLLLQICSCMTEQKILYVTGEESAAQIKLRAKRLGIERDNIFLLCETDIDSILSEINELSPDILIIDSVQTMVDRSLSSSPGSVAQVNRTAASLISASKQSKMATILVGHVNKDGVIAGPKLLEHMVDVVLYFEGERSQSCRVIRAIKNRYGSTNEIGLFEMTDTGLEEVPDPSKRLWEDSPKNVSGSCPVCLMEGTRPIIAEVQALITKSPFNTPKRLSTGVDYNRMSILLAVLEKRLGLKFYDKDVYLNVIGGLRFDETATDLGIITAIISCIRDIKLDGGTIAIGEVGLSGECRAINSMDLRIKEAARLGFERILMPKRAIDRLKIKPSGIKLVPIRSVYDLINAIDEKRGE